MKSTATVTSSDQGRVNLMRSLEVLTRKQVYVGIPATTAAERQDQVRQILGKRKKARPVKQSNINNAELMYIHTHGSPLRHIPARPVIEPAIEDSVNSEQIANELKLAGVAALDGKPDQVTRQLNLAGTVATNAVRGWFTNPKNGWAPNAPSTIRRKGSSRPLIDTGALRKAITHVISEE